MNDDDFKVFARILKEKSGISLSREKIYLLESRLKPVVERYGTGNLAGLAVLLRGVQNNTLVYDMIEAMTTHETLFFRDDRPFRHLRDTLFPQIIKQRSGIKNLKIWSAACSTGQEPYSLAIILSELLQGQAGWKIDILGTDISKIVLDQARAGIYGQFEIQRGLPAQMMVNYFTRQGAQWQINERIQKMVKFEPFNLIQNMEKFGKFDIIFCRNVLIYFDEPTKKTVLQNMSRCLLQDGFLFLGGAESALCAQEHYEIDGGCPGLYRPIVPGNKPLYTIPSARGDFTGIAG